MGFSYRDSSVTKLHGDKKSAKTMSVSHVQCFLDPAEKEMSVTDWYVFIVLFKGFPLYTVETATERGETGLQITSMLYPQRTGAMPQ